MDATLLTKIVEKLDCVSVDYSDQLDEINESLGKLDDLKWLTETTDTSSELDSICEAIDSLVEEKKKKRKRDEEFVVRIVLFDTTEDNSALDDVRKYIEYGGEILSATPLGETQIVYVIKTFV